jgi:lipopolysaccharide export system permease protein
MNLIYKKYIALKFINSFFKTLILFSTIVFIMSLFEEISFFDNANNSMLIPVFLTFINLPSIIFEIFPFIFLISAVNFFLELSQNNEINSFKNFGITNLKILKILTVQTFIIGVLLIVVFYTISSKLKFVYLDIKNQYTTDDKYLAVVNENGLWIREEKLNEIRFINAEKINNDNLINTLITIFDKNFNLKKTIISKTTNISNKTWVLYDAKVNVENESINFEKLIFETNFDKEKLLTTFGNLSALNIYEIRSLKNDYLQLGYTINEINSYQFKIYSYPIYFTLMVLIGSILMLRTKHNKSKIFHAILAILISVLIYYVDFFFNSVIEKKDYPYYLHIWSPQLILILVVSANILSINEK